MGGCADKALEQSCRCFQHLRWKLVRNSKGTAWELFYILEDHPETRSQAPERPVLVEAVASS